MHPSTHREAERIFIELLDLAPALRPARLQEACAGLVDLQTEVQALLRATEEADAFFEGLRQRLGLADANVPAVQPIEDLERTGQSLGAYTLTHLLGRGGMGEVWCAERADGRYTGQVAIKLLAAPGAISRHSFEREARHLARLSHPNIARLLDADATPQGNPYLVLEYVDGEPIDAHCNHRLLTIEQRVRLFLQVLDAIAHAHANLVVHRDIKPSNVRVTPQGQIKVLDFGISKLVTGEEPFATGAEVATLALALTPQFAAPEQIDGAAVTTATDVYALGLLLWALVAGCTPRSGHNLQSLADLRAAALAQPGSLLGSATRAGAPQKLAEVALQRGLTVGSFEQVLRGDLDPVLRKAVAVEPGERYATASEFAQDLRRFLAHEPVMACAATAAYRMRKFVRRHRGGVAATAFVTCALLGTTAYAVWQGVESRRQRDLAAYQQWRAQTSTEFLGFLVTDLGAAGRPVTAAELLDRGVAMVQTRADTAPMPWAGPVLYELASAYFALEMPDRATELLARAEAASRVRNDHDLLASILCTRSRLVLRADPSAARRLAAEARALPVPAGHQSAELITSCGRAQALLLEADGDRLAAMASLQVTLAQVRGAAPDLRRPLFMLLNELSRMHFDRRDLAAALATSRELLAQMEAAGLGHSLGYLIIGMNISSVLTALGEIADSHRLQTELIERIRGMAPEARPKGLVLPMAANLIRLGRAGEALQLVATDEAALRAAGEKPTMHQALSRARALIFMDRTDEGLRVLDGAEAELRKAVHRNDRLLDNAATARVQALRRQGDLAAAAAAADSLLQRMGHGGGPRQSPDLLHGLKLAAQVALDRGDAARARQLAGEALAEAQRLNHRPDASADIGQALMLRAKAQRALGATEAARADAASAVLALAGGLGAEHPETTEAHTFGVAR